MSWELKEKYRRILSGEQGYYKKAWGGKVHLCLAYPNVYRTGMANLGFQTVYRILNSQANCLCDRVFLPDPDDQAELNRRQMPLLGLETGRPLRDFDILAFSLPFENDFPHILSILALGRIPLASRDRTGRSPVVMGGGIAVTLNPEPLADFFDLFILGEAEEALVQFIDLFDDATRSGIPREELLLTLQKEVRGVYVPQFYQVTYGADYRIRERKPLHGEIAESIPVRHVADVDAFPTARCLTARDAEFGEMHVIEISRGCLRGCRFCAAGFSSGPARFRSLGVLTESLAPVMEGMPRIGLLGAAVSDHPDLLALCRFIRAKGGDLSIGSLRVDRIDRELVSLLREGGAVTLTLAPEAGTQRLRNLVHKGIRDEQIFRAAELLAEEGIPNVKLYYMIGLPTEEEADIEAIVHLTKQIEHHARSVSRSKRPFKRITVSLSQFIPKAATPFQWHPLAGVDLARKRIRDIISGLKGHAAVRVVHDLVKWNYIQALLSLGDRRVSAVLLAVHRHGGNWPKAMKEVNINPDFYVYRQKDLSEILPWDFIDHGVPKARLSREYRRSLAGVGSPVVGLR